MQRHLVPLIALVLIVIAGVVHGVLTERFGVSAELQDAAARLKAVPARIGDWTSEDTTIPDRALEIGEIDAYLARRYVKASNNQAVDVIIVCGRPGPISVHTPDICFRGTGFDLSRNPSREVIKTSGDETLGAFWLGDFSKPGPGFSEKLRIVWTWSADGTWIAPDNPRLEFARQEFLYKMYVSRSVLPSGENAIDKLQDDPCAEFLRTFLPVLNDTLFAEETDAAP